MGEFLLLPYLALVNSLPEATKVLSSREHPASTHLNESETPMKINSRFAKTTVAAALVVASGAATLGITSFVSAEIQDSENPAVVAEQSGEVGVTGSETVAETPAVVEGEVSASAAPRVESTATDTTAKRNSPIAVAATALGMTEAELVTELQAGKSIADVASAKSVDLDTVIDALYADLKAHIDAHVAEGKLTQEQADAKLADAKTRITTMVNTAGPLRGKGMGGHKGGPEGRGAPKFVTEDLATVLGLSLDELNTEMQAGKTLAQIAEAKNVSIDKVKDQLLADYTAKEQAEVAEGKHTQEEVDAKIAEFKTRLDDIV
ncbi:MAG: hypothetical protein RLY50_1387, partial [Actinomycetota bacterium]